MRRILTLLLVFSLCLGLCGCSGIFINLDFSDEPEYVPPTVTEPTYDPPNEDDAISQYLTNKYGGNFEHKSYDAKQGTLYYTSEDYPNHLFMVRTVDALWMSGHDISLYEGDYADNGYFAVSYNEAYRYYWDLIEYIPDCAMLIDYDGDVVPSEITPDTPFAEAKEKYPDIFTPTIFILREKQLTNQEVENLKLHLEYLGEKVSVYIVVGSKDLWSDATVEKLYDNSKLFTFRQFFDTNPETAGE